MQYTEYLRRDEVLILLDAKCLRHVATPPCLDESSVGSLTVECCHSCYLRVLITVLRCDVHYLSARLMMEVQPSSIMSPICKATATVHAENFKGFLVSNISFHSQPYAYFGCLLSSKLSSLYIPSGCGVHNLLRGPACFFDRVAIFLSESLVKVSKAFSFVWLPLQPNTSS